MKPRTESAKGVTSSRAERRVNQETKKLIPISLFLILMVYMFSCSVPGTDSSNNDKLWYPYPAEYWNSQSLHLGNGFIGASFFGGIEAETFALTEGSMWRGGPFNGNWEAYGVNPKSKESIQKIQDAMLAGNIALADSLSDHEYLGEMSRFGNFTSIGDLKIEMIGHEGEHKDYMRSLDLSKSLGHVTYTLGNNTSNREYFCSYPHRVLVMKYTSDEPGELGFELGLEVIQQNYECTSNENSLILDGVIDNTDDRKFRVEIVVENFGGSCIAEGERLIVSEADSSIVWLSIATDYKQEFPYFRGGDPVEITRKTIARAMDAGYDAVKRAHIEDYQELYSRVKLDLEGDPELAKLPTNERWELMRSGNPDPGIKELAFNLGRYLIISSSRPGSLPANLQGKWNTFYVPPWTGNYQANINIQEIYWPCGPMNLLECQEPYIDWTVELAKSGRIMADKVYGSGGWISHTVGNIYGHTPPVGGIPWGVYPLAPVWHCQHLWEQFTFSQDTQYLAEVAYPLIKEASQFLVENLFEYDDYLIVGPSISAEHGAVLGGKELQYSYAESSLDQTVYNIPGAAQDAQMIRDLFRMCTEGASVLGVDKEFVATLREIEHKLVPHMVGKHGQLQEWLEDIDSPEDIHRHISHLYAVCPGNDIHPLTTPELAEAAKKSLDMRGEGRFMDIEIAAGGNWSMAWRIWCWTRLMDGDRADKIFTQMLDEQGFENLCTHQHAEYDMGRPDLFHEPGPMFLHFQLDGTATTPGFMAEMLLQSHLDKLILLPALPSRWKNGKVEGLKARGGYTIDLSWEDGELKEALIQSPTGDYPEIYLVYQAIDPEKDPRIKLY